MVSMHWALRLVALTCLATSVKPAAQVVPPVPPNYSAFIPGNRVAVLNLCDAAASGQFSAYQHYYFIEIVQGAQFPAPTGTLRIDGVRGVGRTLRALFLRSRARLTVFPHLYYAGDRPEHMLETLGQQLGRHRR